MKYLWWALVLIAIVGIGIAASYFASSGWQRRVATIAPARQPAAALTAAQREQALLAAVRDAEKRYAKSDPRRRFPLEQLGLFYQGEQAYAKSETVFRRLYTNYGDTYAPFLGGLLVKEGRLHDAEVVFRQSLAERQRAARSPFDEKVSDAQVYLASCYMRQAQWGKSAPLFRHALATQRHNLAQLTRALASSHNSPQAQQGMTLLAARKLTITLNAYASVLSHLNKPAEAAQARAEARQFTTRYGHFSTPAPKP